MASGTPVAVRNSREIVLAPQSLRGFVVVEVPVVVALAHSLAYARFGQPIVFPCPINDPQLRSDFVKACASHRPGTCVCYGVWRVYCSSYPHGFSE